MILLNLTKNYDYHLSILMQLLLSFDQDMTVEKTLIQTLSCQLSSILMHSTLVLSFSSEQDMTVHKTLTQTLASKLAKNILRKKQNLTQPT